MSRFQIIGLAILTTFVLPTSVYADAEKNTEAVNRYNKFHHWVYYPVHVIAYLVAGPIIIATSVVQHKDDKLKAEAGM